MHAINEVVLNIGAIILLTLFAFAVMTAFATTIDAFIWLSKGRNDHASICAAVGVGFTFVSAILAFLFAALTGII